MSMNQEEIEALMSGVDDISHEDIEETSIAKDLGADDSSLDELVTGVEGIAHDEVQEATNHEQVEELIDKNQYPFPAKDENKVVSQLSQVADDSEEKASQIFDVLSFILDENNEIQAHNKKVAGFLENQTELLESLSIKFPKIAVFQENLQEAKELLENTNSLEKKIEDENNKIFEAMELMQYHDINRQKIERVMSVIKKLNNYLNGIFEDDSGKAEVQIAKHIPGDSNEIVSEDDIESLIADFSEQ